MVCLKSQDQENAEAHMAAQNGIEPVSIQPVAPPTPSPPVLPPLPPPPSPPVLPPLPPPPPFIYPFNQHHPNDGNGNYYWNGEHGTHLHSWSDVNQTTAQENVQLCAKLQEFEDLEAKKQDLALQESDFEISKLKRAEADSLKKQLEESEKCRMSAEEMVRKWESCYYHDMDKLLKQNDDKLQAQRASDETFWKKKLDHLARRHEAEKKELRNKLMENGDGERVGEEV